MPNILLAVGNYASEPYSEDENEIIRRFAAVFEQSYTRFLDLKQAEAQAREARIEAALERVRARTMAMQRSDELSEVAAVIYAQLNILGFRTLQYGFDLIDRETLAMSHWLTNAEGKVVPASGKATDVHILTRRPVTDAMLGAWQRGEPGFFIELSGEDLASYMALVKTYLLIPDAVWRGGRLADVDRIFINHFHFSQGILSARTLEPLTPEQRDVGFRFTRSSIWPTPVFSICKRPKPRPAKPRSKRPSNASAPKPWPCTEARTWQRLYLPSLGS